MPACRRRAALLIAALAMAAGCALRPLPQVDKDLRTAATTAHLPVDQIVRGRALLVGACAACHAPVHPLDLDLASWDDAMPRMLRKAGLGDADGAAVHAYVQLVQQTPIK